MLIEIQLNLDEANAIVEGRKTFHRISGRNISEGDIIKFYVGVVPSQHIKQEIDECTYMVEYVEDTSIVSWGDKQFSFCKIMEEDYVAIPFDRRVSIPAEVCWPRYSDGRFVRVGDDIEQGHINGIEFGYRDNVKLHTESKHSFTCMEIKQHDVISTPSVRVYDDNKHMYRPVQVGEIVYDVDSGEKFEVSGFAKKSIWALRLRNKKHHEIIKLGDEVVRNFEFNESEAEGGQF